MVLALVILALLLTLAFFYLKCSMMQSFMTLWSAVLATIIAFSYYELIADLFISRGFGLDWALFGCFTLIFIVVFASLRSISEFLFPAAIDLGDAIKLPTSLVCGLLTGVIISGNLLVALGLFPKQGKVFYSRFDPDAPVVLSSPRTPALSTDGFVTGLYSQISSGSLSSDKSFAVFHADYLSQIHLNKLKTKIKKEESSDRFSRNKTKVKTPVLTICSREALILPGTKDPKPIRRQTVDDEEITIVRAGVYAKKIEDGGANNASGKVEFFPAQIRMIVKKATTTGQPMTGTATVLYPIGFWKNGALIKSDLDKIISPDSEQIKDRVYWMDIAFQCPQDKKPVLLEFKQNAVVDLASYEVVKNTPEIERALDNEGQKKESH